jgi:peptide/nickel transport system substrate-binding protein
MNMKRSLLKARGLIIALGLILSLASCDGKKENTVSGGAKKYRDSINIAITAQPPTLDSANTASNIALEVAAQIFEPLYTLNGNYEPVPDLAESVAISPDGLTYTFPLRRGIKFHNGKELKAEDVVVSMNRWLAMSSRAKALLTNSKFEEVDPYTVKLTVEFPASDILILLATFAQFPSIMPREIIESAPPEGITEYIGTGPYKFNEWKQDQYIHLVRYDGFQSRNEAPSGLSGRKTAPTPNLYYYIVKDQSTRIAGLRTGQYDVTELPTENFEEFEGDAHFTIYPTPGGVLSAYFNTRESVLGKNLKIRQAALAAFNNAEIMLASYSNPNLYIMNPGFTNPAQTQWQTDAGSEFYNQANPERAKQLLAEGGYKGETITLHATPDYAEMYNATIVIQENLRQAGFNVQVVSYDFPTWMATKGDLSKWDIFVASTGYQLTPPQLLAVTPDWAGLRNETISTGLRAIRSAPNAQVAKDEWSKVQRFLYENAAATSIGHYTSDTVVNASLEGFENFRAAVVWNARIPE